MELCPISHEVIENKYTLPCKHEFEYTNIKKWYKKNNSCPLCRCDFVIEDERTLYNQIIKCLNTELSYLADKYKNDILIMFINVDYDLDSSITMLVPQLQTMGIEAFFNNNNLYLNIDYLYNLESSKIERTYMINYFYNVIENRRLENKTLTIKTNLAVYNLIEHMRDYYYIFDEYKQRYIDLMDKTYYDNIMSDYDDTDDESDSSSEYISEHDYDSLYEL